MSFALLSLISNAQVRIHVLDEVSRENVADAHISAQPLNGTHGITMVSGAGGRTSLVFDGSTIQRGLVVRISCIGYQPLVDTLYTKEQRTFLVVRSLHVLPEVVVTGQYAPNTPDAAVHKVRILDAEYFQLIAANNLADGLRNELNIRLQQDNILGTSMSMQGMSGENVKILVDGVPVIGRLDGDIDLSQLDLTGIERAEIIEGPLSVSYGTNALAGTINLITKKRGQAPASVKATLYAEEIGRLNTTITGTRRWGRNDVLLTFGRNFFGGWDPDQSSTLSFKPRPADSSRYQAWKPREQYFGRMGFRRVIGLWDLGYKGELMNDRIINKGRPRPPYYETAFDEEYVTVRLDNALFAEGRLGGGRRVNALVAHDIYSRSRITWFKDLTTLGEQLAEIDGMQDTTRFTLTNVRTVFTNAPDSSRVQYELGMDLGLETGAGVRVGTSEKEIGDHAVFASMEMHTSDRLTFRPGLRLAHNTKYDAPLVPSLNVRWQALDAITLRASYARGFRAPSLKELYFFFVDVNHDIVGNPDLEAEYSHNLSVGLTDRRSSAGGVLRSEINLFYNAIEDLITLAQITGTRYSYINVGELHTTGGTLGAAWENDKWIFSLGGGLTGRYDALAAKEGGSWFYSPDIRASATRTWRNSGWVATMNGKYQGEQANYVYLSDTEIARGHIAPFTFAELSIGKSLWSKRARIAFGCKNLFNVQNVDATLSGGAHGGTSTSIPMTTGRTFFLRLDIELKKKEG